VVTALAWMAAGEVRAGTMVSYTTSGTFSSSGTNVIELGIGSGKPTIDITFTGTSQTNLGVPDPTAPFGTFEALVVNTGSANRPVSGDFSLLLTQTAPTNDSHTFTSTVSGSIKLDTSNDMTITFASPLSTTFGSITYTIPASVVLASPGNTAGATSTASLTADIVDPAPLAIPEPTTWVSGCTAIVFSGAFLAWRRRRSRLHV
jgi:hypothetical protein